MEELPKRKDWIVEIKWEGSIILYGIRCVNNLFARASVIRLLWRGLARCGIDWAPWWVEVWLVFLISVLFGCLLWGQPGNKIIWWVAFAILLDAIGATIRDIITPLHKGGKIEVYNAVRWLLMVPLNLVQVVLCFAVFALYYGNQFEHPIADAGTAIYFSAVTFSTLGYGDIKPISAATRELVSWELLTFVFFVAIKLPIAVATIKVEEKPEEWL